MTAQYFAAITMFTLTVLFAAGFWFPAIRFPFKNKLVNFYWTGFWSLLSVIMAVSGAKATLDILGTDVAVFGDALLFGLTISFSVFVMFAWGRLALKGAGAVTAKVIKNG